ncbi:MAG: tetratricopeptide repeat protein [Candidatus Omnitrophica bacterium]|nr:tetratricopeptide repeat protein [Candidatus Omnitrophota bacterium]
MISKLKSSPKITFLLIICIFLLAFFIRFIYLDQIKDNPFFTPYEGGLDDYLYDTWAREIAFTDFVGKEVFWGLPLYPYFLGLVYFLFGRDLYIARLIQFAIGALNCVLLYFIGKKVFNKSTGIIASIMLALYSPAIFYEGFLSGSFLSIFLNSIAIILILQTAQKSNWKKWFSIGLLIGISGLSGASIFLFLPFLIYWLFKTFKKFNYRKRLSHATSLLVGVLIIIGVVTLRNYVVGKDFVPTTWHNGITFYAGNNPASNGTFILPSSVGISVATAKVNSRLQAEKALNKRLKPSEVSNFWFRQGLTFIKNEPARYTRLLIDKFLIFWNAYEISDVLNIGLFIKKFSPFLQARFFMTFAVIFPLFILGVILSFKLRHQAGILLLYLLISSHTLSVMLYFVNGRYRLPIVPFLMIFSAYSVVWIFSKIKNRDFVKVALILPILVAAILFENMHLIYTGPEAFYNNLGVVYKRKGMYKKAEKEYREAIRLKPDYVTPHFNLGILYWETGELQKATEEFKKAVRLNPEFYKARNKLAKVYMASGQNDRAVYHLEKSLQANPNQPDIRDLLKGINNN